MKQPVRLTVPKNVLELSDGDTILKKNLFDLIQYSKQKDSIYWGGKTFIIGNTPQQGINWIGEFPTLQAVIIKSCHEVYKEDGWINGDTSRYRYALKARNGKVNTREKANMALLQQPDNGYPIFLFTEYDSKTLYFAGIFSVIEHDTRSVLLGKIIS